MPEIVEVKKYCDFIKKHIVNNKIISVSILKGRYKKHKPFEGYHYFQKNLPLLLNDVQSKGKFIYMTFDNNITLFCTLGLSGGWVYKSNNNYLYPKMLEFLNVKDIDMSQVSYYEKSLNHLNIEFKTSNGSLYFFDTLSFGTIKVVESIEELNKKLSTLGPDIMDINTTIDIFSDRITKYKNKKIGIVLLNQKIISGIGNYLRADMLWLAKISPFRLVKNLSDRDIKALYNAIILLTWGRYNYKKAVKFHIIKNNMKLPSDYKRDFFVYYETIDLYGNNVKKELLYEGSQKRFIYWVPGYQI